MIKLLIVEDSKVVSEYLQYIFSQDEQIEIIGVVTTGKQAVDFVKIQKPDVITMDIDLPEMNGLEATRQIMSTTPVPILVVTASRNANEINISIEALAAGALAVVEKPVGIHHHKAEELSRKLVNLVKLMSEVSVITRKHKAPSLPKPVKIKAQINNIEVGIPSVVAIGVSSGGPQTLQVVFSKISGNFPAPILVVQHISPGFINGLVSWLQNNMSVPVSVAQADEIVAPGHIYFAPDGYQMGVTYTGKIVLEKPRGNGGFCPSIAHLYNQVANNYGSKAIGIILTGMGSDGAHELKLMHDKGALTIAQSKESALIFGIPGVAIQIGAVDHILSDEEISLLLFEIEKNCR
jgi:two-component system, chemotaxis family, protein-glutamate methylesterase/glutaminase